MGADGRLGRALCETLGGRVALATNRRDADITDADVVERVIAALRPDVVYNATAWNAVDAAEKNVTEAFAVNASGPRHIAVAARRCGATVVHVSTNYVFAGDRAEPYDETDPALPGTVYGISKRAGERLVETSGAEHVVVRTSAVFGIGGSAGKAQSFVTRVVEAARRGEELAIVDDQFVCATYAKDLARAIVGIVERAGRGTFHVTNTGITSWFNLAQTAVRLAGLKGRSVRPVKSADLPTLARRPMNTPLASVRLGPLGVRPLRSWQEALQEFLAS